MTNTKSFMPLVMAALLIV